jgi:hypothetical protein
VAKYAELVERKKAMKEAAEPRGRGAKLRKLLAYARRATSRLTDLYTSCPERADRGVRPQRRRTRRGGSARASSEEKKYDDVSTINNYMLTARMRDWPGSLLDKVRRFLVTRVARSAYLRKK